MGCRPQMVLAVACRAHGCADHGGHCHHALAGMLGRQALQRSEAQSITGQALLEKAPATAASSPISSPGSRCRPAKAKHLQVVTERPRVLRFNGRHARTVQHLDALVDRTLYARQRWQGVGSMQTSFDPAMSAPSQSSSALPPRPRPTCSKTLPCLLATYTPHPLLRPHRRLLVVCVVEAHAPVAKVGGDDEQVGGVVQVGRQQAAVGGLAAGGGGRGRGAAQVVV